MDIDEELLEEDDVDTEYNLDNETENALLQDDGEASVCSKDEHEENEAGPEDVLDLEANEVELNEEDDDGHYKYNSSQDEGQRSERHDKFTSERNNDSNKSQDEVSVKSLPPRQIGNVNYRQFQKTRGRIRGSRGFYHRREGRKVLINPHFKGNVQVPNGTTRLLWDSQKNVSGSNERYQQQPFKPNVGTIQPWLTPLPVNQQTYVPPPSVSLPPTLNVPVLQEAIRFQQIPNWNQCNVPNNFPQQVNRNVPVHQRLGFTNNFNQEQRPLPPQPAPVMQPVYQNNFNQAPPPPQYVPPQFTTPPPPLNHPPSNQQNTFYNNFEAQNPNYNNQYQMQPPSQHQAYNQPPNQQQVYNNQPLNQQQVCNNQPPSYPNSFNPPQNVIRNTYKQHPKQKLLALKNFSKRNFDNKAFDQRKKKRFVAQNLHEVQTVGEIIRQVREVKQSNEQLQETTSDEQEEDEETKQYRKMIEKQKEAREKILRAKEARRMLTLKKGGEPPETVAPAPAELVKKFETPSIGTKTLTMQVQVKNSNKNSQLKSERIVAFTKKQTDDDDSSSSKDDISSFSSSFLSNRKVLCKDQFLPETPLVVIKDLASGTTEVKLYKLCSGIGDVQKLQLSKEERQATIQFKSVASAHAFYKKYQRYMLDLSMIQVALKPMT